MYHADRDLIYEMFYYHAFADSFGYTPKQVDELDESMAKNLLAIQNGLIEGRKEKSKKAANTK